MAEIRNGKNKIENYAKNAKRRGDVNITRKPRYTGKRAKKCISLQAYANIKIEDTINRVTAYSIA